MPRKSKKKTLRIKNLIMICTLSAIVLTVSTYAWFIGMRTVNVSSFDVEIASTNSLLLSLDGDKWSQSVEINSDNFNTDAYANNTNSWGTGLVPLSSVGKIDTVASRLVLYEKASLTATPGGYRLLASRVNNFNKDGEGKLENEFSGYVVFDLFVKNFSGTQYLENYNELDEEAIYLTVDSEVAVSLTGVTPGVKDTGIENSVRVAFAQIGRVAGTSTDVAKITGITCNASGEDNEPSIVDGVTGICRTAQIWEPNDRDHVANAISWYNNSCLSRTGTDVTLTGSYSGACRQIIDGVSYPTYAISSPIGSDNNVDIYDGAAYNSYATSQTNGFLHSFPYFKDTDKLLTGTERPEFMRLAPNSITKVRVYIWIEGQDIDNYDFAAIGKKISVQFGFTKERYTEDDINYPGNGGPDLNQGEGPNGSDLTAPIITLEGDAVVTHVKGTPYVDEGATAEDNIDETVTVVTSGVVNTDVVGTYYITYKATDAAGNVGTKTRTVNVVED